MSAQSFGDAVRLARGAVSQEKLAECLSSKLPDAYPVQGVDALMRHLEYVESGRPWLYRPGDLIALIDAIIKCLDLPFEAALALHLEAASYRLELGGYP